MKEILWQFDWYLVLPLADLIYVVTDYVDTKE
jgi:hypothetical protein